MKGAIVIGLVAGLICYYAMDFRIKRGLDESLDAWAIHGVGGAWGSLAIALFANSNINGYSGLFYGNASLLIPQFVAVIATMAYALIVTFILAKIVDKTIGLRVSEKEEYVGLDISQHGEVAYT